MIYVINGIVRKGYNIEKKPADVNSRFFYKHDNNIADAVSVLTKNFSKYGVPLLHV